MLEKFEYAKLNVSLQLYMNSILIKDVVILGQCMSQYPML